MFRKIILLTSSFASITAPVLALPVIDKNDNGKTIKYDNKYFSNDNDVLLYYLKTHPNIIKQKSVIGDISRSTIDADYNMLNTSNLYDYKYSKVKAAYKKSSNQLTSDYEEARSSYANPVFIREKFQGASDKTFSSKEDAIKDRSKNMLTINQGYLRFKNPLTKEYQKYNPLNEGDYNFLKSNLIKAINKSSVYKLPDIYKKSFDFKKFESKWNNSEYSYFNDVSHDEYADYLKEPIYVGSNIKLNEISLKNNIKGLKDTIDLTQFANIKSGDVSGTHGFWIDINFLKDTDGNKHIYMKTQGGLNKSYNHWGDDSGDTKVWFVEAKMIDQFISKKSKVVFESSTVKDIDEIIKDNSTKSIISVKATDTGNNNIRKYDNINLNSTKKWRFFIEKAQKTIKKARKRWGQNIDATLTINLKTDTKKFEKGFIIHHYSDTSGSTNKHYLKSLNTNYLNYELKVKPKQNEESILNKFIPEIKKIFNEKINGNTNYNLSPTKIFDDWIKSPYMINAKSSKEYIKNSFDLDILKKINDNSSFKEWFKSISEFISFGTQDKNIQSFKIERETNKIISKLTLLNQDFENGWSKNVSYIKDNTNISQKNLDIIFGYLANKVNKDYNKIALAFNCLKNSNISVNSHASIDGSFSNKDILMQYLNEIKKYLKINYKYEKNIINNKSAKDYFLNNYFFKNAKFNSEWFLLINNIKNSKIEFKTGKYLLLNDRLFNTSFSFNGSNNVGPEGIYTTEQLYNTYYKVAISADPPIVRVMYDIDGKIIAGQGISLQKSNNKSEQIYDQEEVFLENAFFQADVHIDHDYVYYITDDNAEHLILYQISTIYTLYIYGKLYFFKAHEGLIKYLKEQIMLQETVYN